MARIKIHSLLCNQTDQEQHSFDGYGLLSDNQIKFIEEETNVEITIESEEIIIQRIHGQDTLVMIFHPTLTREGIYDIKSVSIELHLKTKTKQLIRNENGFELSYQMELEGEKSKNFLYQIEYEVVT